MDDLLSQILEEESESLYVGHNRTACSVLKEMRDLMKTSNSFVFDKLLQTMPYLIEELQSMVNRMEAALYDKKDMYRAYRKVRELKDEHTKLVVEIRKMKKELNGGEDA